MLSKTFHTGAMRLWCHQKFLLKQRGDTYSDLGLPWDRSRAASPRPHTTQSFKNVNALTGRLVYIAEADCSPTTEYRKTCPDSTSLQGQEDGYTTKTGLSTCKALIVYTTLSTASDMCRCLSAAAPISAVYVHLTDPTLLMTAAQFYRSLQVLSKNVLIHHKPWRAAWASTCCRGFSQSADQPEPPAQPCSWQCFPPRGASAPRAAWAGTRLQKGPPSRQRGPPTQDSAPAATQ